LYIIKINMNIKTTCHEQKKLLKYIVPLKIRPVEFNDRFKH